MKLHVEFNSKFVKANDTIKYGYGAIMITPPIDEDYWIFRVPVSENQAVVAFPKFGTIGVGFQVEADDWNTNLPYTCGAEEIYNHIKCNKGDKYIKKSTCVNAIDLLQSTIREFNQEV